MNRRGEEGTDSQALEGLVKYLVIIALAILAFAGIAALFAKIT